MGRQPNAVFVQVGREPETDKHPVAGKLCFQNHVAFPKLVGYLEQTQALVLHKVGLCDVGNELDLKKRFFKDKMVNVGNAYQLMPFHCWRSTRVEEGLVGLGKDEIFFKEF